MAEAKTASSSASTAAEKKAAKASRMQAMAQAVVSQVDAVATATGLTNKVVRKYTHALAGFLVAGPTPYELRALAADPKVTAIWPNGLRKLVRAGATAGLKLSPCILLNHSLPCLPTLTSGHLMGSACSPANHCFLPELDVPFGT
jgi:hypothetical protein